MGTNHSEMRSSTLLCLTAVTVAALLPAVTAVKVRFVTDVKATLRRGEPGLKPNAACASTDDPAQCAALVDLYTATNGHKWTYNTGWLNGSSYCDWNWDCGIGPKCGVTCDDSGNVAILQLLGNGLTGTIPASLGNLKRLTTMRLSYNKLTGTIPDSLGNLKGLQLLTLYDNQLTGTIPASLGNLKSLQQMSFSVNQLNGTIPDSLGNIQSLRKLDLANNKLTGTIPSSICPHLHAGVLDDCYLGNNDFSCPLPCGTAIICGAACK